MTASYDESEHCKEVYAHFGLAYYDAGVVETGIAIALLYAKFLTKWKDKIKTGGRTNFDRKSYEADFDAFFKDQHSQTFGNILKGLKSAYHIAPELADAIREGKTLRDFLAHHFYRERAVDFAARAGRDRMIAELMAMQEKFRALDRRVQDLTGPVKAKLGIEEETIGAFAEDFIRKAYAGKTPL